MALRIILVVVAFFMLAAHFLRDGATALVVVCLLTPFLLLVRKRWALVFVRILLILGAVVWLQTTLVLVQHRWEAGAPWLRMLLILASVTTFTLLASYGLGNERVEKRYP